MPGRAVLFSSTAFVLGTLLGGPANARAATLCVDGQVA
jgi:hypothetical protein